MWSKCLSIKKILQIGITHFKKDVKIEKILKVLLIEKVVTVSYGYLRKLKLFSFWCFFFFFWEHNSVYLANTTAIHFQILFFFPMLIFQIQTLSPTQKNLCVGLKKQEPIRDLGSMRQHHIFTRQALLLNYWEDNGIVAAPWKEPDRLSGQANFRSCLMRLSQRFLEIHRQNQFVFLLTNSCWQ